MVYIGLDRLVVSQNQTNLATLRDFRHAMGPMLDRDARATVNQAARCTRLSPQLINRWYQRAHLTHASGSARLGAPRCRDAGFGTMVGWILVQRMDNTRGRRFRRICASWRNVQSRLVLTSATTFGGTGRGNHGS